MATNVTSDHDIAVEKSRDPMAGSTAVARETVNALAGSIADPAPLGLAGFALTTFVLSCVNAGWVHKGTEPIVLGLALAYGGLAQLLAGMWEFKKGNTFGATAFASYGAFWISFWAFVVFYAGKVPKADATQAVGLYLFAWGIFTLYMWIASFKTTAAVNIVFFLLTITFFLLAFGEWGTSSGLSKLGGYFGLATAAVAWYASFAGVINSTFGKVMLPTKPLHG
ncbi:MAG TPA: acetate uptake transporter [Acidimicrobiia bacterium]|nr:acetate uptake transporter [Acidimicrobiia bacterium]